MNTLNKVRIGAGMGLDDDEGDSIEACCVEEAMLAGLGVLQNEAGILMSSLLLSF